MVKRGEVKLPLDELGLELPVRQVDNSSTPTEEK